MQLAMVVRSIYTIQPSEFDASIPLALLNQGKLVIQSHVIEQQRILKLQLWTFQENCVISYCSCPGTLCWWIGIKLKYSTLSGYWQFPALWIFEWWYYIKAVKFEIVLFFQMFNGLFSMESKYKKVLLSYCLMQHTNMFVVLLNIMMMTTMTTTNVALRTNILERWRFIFIASCLSWHC